MTSHFGNIPEVKPVKQNKKVRITAEPLTVVIHTLSLYHCKVYMFHEM